MFERWEIFHIQEKRALSKKGRQEMRNTRLVSRLL